MTLTIKLEYSNDRKMWLMSHAKSDIFIQEFFDCATMRKVFAGIRRGEEKCFKVTIVPTKG